MVKGEIILPEKIIFLWEKLLECEDKKVFVKEERDKSRTINRQEEKKLSFSFLGVAKQQTKNVKFKNQLFLTPFPLILYNNKNFFLPWDSDLTNPSTFSASIVFKIQLISN
jgi:hypothetical protein